MDVQKAEIKPDKFNRDLVLPYELRLADYQLAMQDVYDFFYDMNCYLLEKGLQRLDEMLRPATMSGVLSDMISDALAKHSRVLTVNLYHNGHPDLVVQGRYPSNTVKAGEDGVEIKSTRKRGGAVDMHGARKQTLSVFVYEVDNDRTKAAHEREPMIFREVYIASVMVEEFRKNERGALGTRTATVGAAGMKRFRESWVYRDVPAREARRGQWRERDRP